MTYRYCDVSELKGLTIASIDGLGDDYVVIKTECGETYGMQHFQDCCESVGIKQVFGMAADIIGVPVDHADQSTSDCSGEYSSGTRTTFTIHTRNGTLIIIWEGYSNGYYGEGVSFYEDDGSGSRW